MLRLLRRFGIKCEVNTFHQLSFFQYIKINQVGYRQMKKKCSRGGCTKKFKNDKQCQWSGRKHTPHIFAQGLPFYTKYLPVRWNKLKYSACFNSFIFFCSFNRVLQIVTFIFSPCSLINSDLTMKPFHPTSTTTNIKRTSILLQRSTPWIQMQDLR